MSATIEPASSKTFDSSIRDLIARFGVSDATVAFLAEPKLMFVGGKRISASDSATLDVAEPSTGGHLAVIPDGTLEDLELAVLAARRALAGPWRDLKPNEREKMLLRLSGLVERDAQILAEIETLDNGKAIGPCLDVDILGAADLLRYMAGWTTKIEGATRQVSASGEHLAMTLKEPVGVVGAIVPWNWPFSMAVWKLAAPLAAGCSIVLKPASQTSLSMIYFARLLEEAEIPPGVVNIVTGDGARLGERLCQHPGVDKVSFTGSTPVGRQVGAAAGRALSQVTLELGGKSAMIAFADADISAVAAATRWSVFFNAGQVCSAGSRLYVHASILDEMLVALKSVVSAMKMAPGLDPECDIGPVISAQARDRILNEIEIAKAEGADVVIQGNDTESDGAFVAPTVVVAPRNDLRIVQEEIFGPVLTVIPFNTEQEAIELANQNAYGLAASVWTKDVSRALRVSRRLEAGTVWVNAHDLVDSAMPFGGVKASGFGRDLGPEQVRHYLQTKTVWLSVEPLADEQLIGDQRHD